MNLKETIGKGVIELVLMSLLSKEDMYGYQITQTISSLTNGLLNINTGALYTTLYKLEENGYISSKQEKFKTRQTRVYYHLTETGRIQLEELRGDYIKLQTALNCLLDLKL